jgi:hypothetical protein
MQATVSTTTTLEAREQTTLAALVTKQSPKARPAFKPSFKQPDEVVRIASTTHNKRKAQFQQQHCMKVKRIQSFFTSS